MTTTLSVVFDGKLYTDEVLNSLRTKDIIDVYNLLARRRNSAVAPITRFESRAKGLIRCWNALAAYQTDVLIEDALENPDTTPNSNLDRGADFVTGEFDVPALEDDGLTKPKEKSANLDKQIKAVKTVATKPATKVDRLLEVLYSLPDGADITVLSCVLGCDAKRVRGLIDSARSRGTRIVKVEGVKSTWRLAVS